MIGIFMSGGLGNQLFEYAFIYNQKKKLRTNFFLIKSGEPIRLYRYFELDKNIFYYLDVFLFNYTGLKLFFCHYLRGIFYRQITKISKMQDIIVNNDNISYQLLKKAQNNTLFQGYFQSELYFKENIEDIARIYKVKKKYKNEFKNKFTWINDYKNTVVIHIRKTDYKTALGYLNLGSDDLSIPMSYYHKIIKDIHTNDNYYIIISDEIDSVESEFKYLNKKFFSKESEIIDFQLMMNANVCIIANSTFSWWAAYLNEKTNKIVYCPKYFLGFHIKVEHPKSIYPDDWKQIDVR